MIKRWRVVPEVFNERMAICNACPHLENGHTCGPVGRGKDLEDGTHLCGCIMRLKCELPASACPVGKWGHALSRKEIENIKEAIRLLDHGGNPAQRRWVDDILAKYIGGKQNLGCPPCVKKAAEDLRLLL